MKKGAGTASAVLTIRVPRALERKISREARRRRRSRSDLARELLTQALQEAPEPNPEVEAVRQSRLACARESEADVLEFITTAADLRGWT